MPLSTSVIYHITQHYVTPSGVFERGFSMNRSRHLFFIAIVLLLTLLCTCALAKDAIQDFSWTPGDHCGDFTFTAEGQEMVILSYSNSLESGNLILHGENGAFSGTLHVPNTYPGNIVAITIKDLAQKQLMSKTQVTTAIQEIPVVEKAAEGRLAGLTVCVDPGHQGVAIGIKEPMGPGLSGFHTTTNGMAQGIFTRRYEAVVVLEIGMKLRNALLQEGADVVMTRVDQKTAVSNVERANIANDNGSALFIRLHCDTSTQKNKNGIHVYIPMTSEYALAIADKETYKTYGDAMLNALFAATGVTNGSVRQGNGYVANNWAKMPSFLVELGYMSNVREDILLSDPEYQEKLVEGMVNGLVDVARLHGDIN